MAEPRHDWFLKEWLKATGKKQSDIARDLDWNKAKVSLTASGKQPYDRDDVNEVSAYLHIRPYELLMHPSDAMSLRQLQRAAEDIVELSKLGVANVGEVPSPGPAILRTVPRNGTDG